MYSLAIFRYQKNTLKVHYLYKNYIFFVAFFPAGKLCFDTNRITEYIDIIYMCEQTKLKYIHTCNYLFAILHDILEYLDIKNVTL